MSPRATGFLSPLVHQSVVPPLPTATKTPTEPIELGGPLNGRVSPHRNGYETPVARKTPARHLVFSPLSLENDIAADTGPHAPVDGPNRNVRETTEKTNHWVSLCLGSAAIFYCISFYYDYRILRERTISLLLPAAFWSVIATVIGTSGAILKETTKAETSAVPNTTTHDSEAEYQDGQPIKIGNPGNECFKNALTQAFMNDGVYRLVFKSICEGARRRHLAYKKFLQLFPSPHPYLPSWVAMPGFLKQKKNEVPQLFVIENMRDVLAMLMTRTSSLGYDLPEFRREYPHIHRRLGEFARAVREADFPDVSADEAQLRAEFTRMKENPAIIQFFYEEQESAAKELSGFEAYRKLMEAYEKAEAEKSTTLPLQGWLPDVRSLMQGAGGNSQEDPEELLHLLSKYVLLGDYPEAFFPLAYERKWAPCREQNRDKLASFMEKHIRRVSPNDILTEMPASGKIPERTDACCVLKIKEVLTEGADGRELIWQTFNKERAPDEANSTVYLDAVSRTARMYYPVKEKIIIPEKLPERIILELVRTYSVINEGVQRQEKIDCAVHMPEQMEIGGQQYRLKSVVVHTGNAEGGHYHAVLKKGEQWWYASDERVFKGSDHDRTFALTKGNLYFYEKIPVAAAFGEELIAW